MQERKKQTFSISTELATMQDRLHYPLCSGLVIHLSAQGILEYFWLLYWQLRRFNFYVLACLKQPLKLKVKEPELRVVL